MGTDDVHAHPMVQQATNQRRKSQVWPLCRRSPPMGVAQGVHCEL